MQQGLFLQLKTTIARKKYRENPDKCAKMAFFMVI